jgi:hypothetical protein
MTEVEQQAEEPVSPILGFASAPFSTGIEKRTFLRQAPLPRRQGR